LWEGNDESMIVSNKNSYIDSGREGVEKGTLKSSIFYVDAKESLDMMEGMIEFLVEYEFRQLSF
jgi:hypothetical protein